MTQYRWAPASGGEIPSDACENGHGWEWAEGATEDDDLVRAPLWLVRTRPDAGGQLAGSVRLGYVRRGAPAQIGGRWDGQSVDEYEVLLDQGTWHEWRGDLGALTGPALYVKGAIPDAVVCGNTADGEELYATLKWLEGEGIDPDELPASTRTGDVPGSVLVDPVAQEAPPASPPPAQGASGPVSSAVISALDCKNEVVGITNTGDSELDLGGWKLRDRSAAKPYVFPSRTVVAPGGSVHVRSGPGAAKPATGELVWKTANAWNNRGDTAYLEDPAGTLISSKDG